VPMKHLRPCVLCILALSGIAPIVTAQTPHLQAYFDEELTESSAWCPNFEEPGTVVAEFWVVAHNFNAYLAAIEFKINYPPQIEWLTDYPIDGALMIGQTLNGCAMAFPTPLNAYGPAVVMKVGFFWMCQQCGPENENVLLCFDVYPGSGYVRAVRWPDYGVIYATGGTALICPTCCPPYPSCPNLLPVVPVAQSTWGGIKALYK